MYHFFINYTLNNKTIEISGSDYNHIVNVLRLKTGEKVIVTDSNQKSYYCNYIKAEDKKAVFDLSDEAPDTELPVKINLYQGLPKADKFESIIQKSVELGAYSIIPVEMKRCIVKLDDKKKAAKVSRWQLISESASKQSGRTIIPEILPVLTFPEAIKNAEGSKILIAYEGAKGMQELKAAFDNIVFGDNISIFIGPEGGFEENEVEMLEKAGGKSISLGKRILRTETAGPAIIAALMLNTEIKYGE